MNRAPDLEDEPAAEPDPAGDAPVPVAAAPKRSMFVRLREYVWDWRAVVAVGIATFIVGGLAGLAVGLATGHDDGRNGHHDFRNGPGRQFRQGEFPAHQFPGGQAPGQGQGFGSGSNQVPNGN